MARLPVSGSDDGTWGDVLNGFLLVSHNDDGTLKTSAIPDNSVATATIQDGAVTTAKLASTTTLDTIPTAVADVDLGGFKLINVGDPTNAQDAATKAYVDTIAVTPAPHEATHEAGGSDALPWTAIHDSGTLAGRPSAASTNAGYLYLATNVNGGTLYRSNGTTWVQTAMGVTEGLTVANNLSDLGSTSSARTNLGLGNSATRNVGTTTGTVAAGDDSRFASPQVAYTSQSTSYAATTSDCVIAMNATGGNRTVTLPTAVGVTGQTYSIKKTDSSSNTVTIATTSAQTIDGGSTAVIQVQYASVMVVSDGSNWQII